MIVRELKINHILEKAFELFSKEGIDNVTMNNIADKVSIFIKIIFKLVLLTRNKVL